MAQAPKKPQKAGGGGGLVGMIVVTLLAAAGGGGFGFFLYQNFTSSPAKKAEPAHTTGADPAGGHEKSGEPPLIKVIPLNPLVVNLADPADAWLRIEATVVIEGMKEGRISLPSRSAKTSSPTSKRPHFPSSRDRAGSRASGRISWTARRSGMACTSRISSYTGSFSNEALPAPAAALLAVRRAADPCLRAGVQPRATVASGRADRFGDAWCS